mmetsp:Transcript_72949/g.206722  ORF Transcript_72949/g.206722 Transcript_72949/m.206722 type:complete len:330 (-) Transcript_72949:1188-2177(-)
MPRGALLDAVREGDAGDAVHEEVGRPVQDKAVDRLAGVLADRRDVGREAPPPAEQHRVVRREPRAPGQRHEARDAARAPRPRHAHDLGLAAGAALHHVATPQARDAPALARGQLNFTCAVDAAGIAVVEDGHVERALLPAARAVDGEQLGLVRSVADHLATAEVAVLCRGDVRRRQFVERLVGRVPDLCKSAAAVELHARILEVVALLQPVRAQDGGQVVAAPPVPVLRGGERCGNLTGDVLQYRLQSLSAGPRHRVLHPLGAFVDDAAAPVERGLGQGLPFAESQVDGTSKIQKKQIPLDVHLDECLLVGAPDHTLARFALAPVPERL